MLRYVSKCLLCSHVEVGAETYIQVLLEGDL